MNRTRTDMEQVWRRYKRNGNGELRNQLVERYLHLVKYNAERIHTKLPNEVDVEDLMSAGIFGLMDAIDKYDPEKNCKFKTYAEFRIKGAILDQLRSGLAKEINTGAENELCPTGAIKRTFIEDPYYEYTIDESLCNGCGKCVKGCNAFGNGSLFLQVRHDRCVNCNECSIGVACPSGAYKRVSVDEPYLLKTVGHA